MHYNFLVVRMMERSLAVRVKVASTDDQRTCGSVSCCHVVPGADHLLR